jgi:PAS domain-containing protein
MLSHELRWTEEVVQQLQLVARLFANVIHRSQTEQALQESKERYEQLATHNRTIAWEVDEAGLYTYISPVVEDVLGYQPEEIVGRMHFYDLHPEKGREEFKAKILPSIGASFRWKQDFCCNFVSYKILMIYNDRSPAN